MELITDTFALSPALKDFIAGAVAGAFAITVSQPLDTVRVRLQQAASGGAQRNALTVLFDLIRKEGLLSPFKGLTYPLMFASVQSAILFQAYGWTLRQLADPERHPPTATPHLATAIAAAPDHSSSPNTSNLLPQYPKPASLSGRQTSSSSSSSSSAAAASPGAASLAPDSIHDVHLHHHHHHYLVEQRAESVHGANSVSGQALAWVAAQLGSSWRAPAGAASGGLTGGQAGAKASGPAGAADRNEGPQGARGSGRGRGGSGSGRGGRTDNSLEGADGSGSGSRGAGAIGTGSSSSSDSSEGGCGGEAGRLGDSGGGLCGQATTAVSAETDGRRASGAGSESQLLLLQQQQHPPHGQGHLRERQQSVVQHLQLQGQGQRPVQLQLEQQQQQQGPQAGPVPNPWHGFLAGGVAGMAQVFLWSPVELLKLRSQLQTATPGSAGYRNPAALAVQVMRQDGVAGLYRGFTLTVVRDVPSYAMYFWLYRDIAGALSPGMHPEQAPASTQVLAGGLAGVIAWLPIYPLDVIKTRVQAVTATASRGKKWGAYVREMYLEGGSRAFFRGMTTTLVRAFMMDAASFLGYTTTLKMMGGNVAEVGPASGTTSAGRVVEPGVGPA